MPVPKETFPAKASAIAPKKARSTADVTDQHARLYEALAYFPFGEIWIDRGPNTHRIPYRYTAQTLDSEGAVGHLA